MLWRNSQQNFQVYSLKTICGYLTLLGKLKLFQNLFIQGKVGVANGKVGVGYDGRRLILKTLEYKKLFVTMCQILKLSLNLSVKYKLMNDE